VAFGPDDTRSLDGDMGIAGERAAPPSDMIVEKGHGLVSGLFGWRL
jgi:hypothetical protein